MFDLWRDVGCDATTQYLCGAAGPGGQCDAGHDMCLISDTADGGVCTSGDSDL